MAILTYGTIGKSDGGFQAPVHKGNITMRDIKIDWSENDGEEYLPILTDSSRPLNLTQIDEKLRATNDKRFRPRDGGFYFEMLVAYLRICIDNFEKYKDRAWLDAGESLRPEFATVPAMGTLFETISQLDREQEAMPAQTGNRITRLVGRNGANARKIVLGFQS